MGSTFSFSGGLSTLETHRFVRPTTQLDPIQTKLLKMSAHVTTFIRLETTLLKLGRVDLDADRELGIRNPSLDLLDNSIDNTGAII
jgi:hypothetical protein